MSRPEITVAVVSWNGRRHLSTCLPALRDQRDPGVPWEVLVLDNGSSDGTSAWVREHHPEVKLVESPVNLGFCAANNRLVAEAHGAAVAMLNNDTRPESSWLGALWAALKSAPDDVAAVSGKIVDWGGERLDFARGVMTFDGHAFQLDYRRPLALAREPAEAEELLFACGGNLMVRKKSFLDAGGFDEDYFAYLEDVDLGWRLWSGGERVVYALGAIVHHRSSATSDLLGLFNRGFLFERNAYLTVYKNYEEDLWRRMMPGVMLTLMARGQKLLTANNPGGDLLGLDPYDGHIADTGAKISRENPAAGPVARRDLSGLLDKWRRYGPREFFRRALGKLRGAPVGPVRLTDDRTLAQLRAISYILGHLDEAAEKRRRIQRRRRRSDREIFERFPLYLVPTYPGDEELFAGEGFGEWLPHDVPMVRTRLDEVMELG